MVRLGSIFCWPKRKNGAMCQIFAKRCLAGHSWVRFYILQLQDFGQAWLSLFRL